MKYENQFNSIQTMLEVGKDKNPNDTVLLCRSVLEKTITLIFEVKNEKKPVSAQLLELINHETVQSFLGNDTLIDALHFVRIVGINALHGRPIKRTQAKVALDNIEFLLAVVKEKLEDDPKTNIKIGSVSTTKTPIPSVMSEYETRKVYIDLYLNEAGWDVVAPNQKTKLPSGKEVSSGSLIPGKACSEIMVTGLPHGSGIGFCDYVLYGKDGKPLAIVEAKRTSEAAIKGQQQVRQYGVCMKKQYGYTPILYYTNGYDIYIIDGKYPPRKIAAFHTLEELEYLIKRRSIDSIADTRVDKNIAGRPYQNMAISAICDRFNTMHRKSLLVMATGTGKTRTAIALVELLFRNNWVRNVLFLADRTSLVSQAFKNFQHLLPDYTYNVVSDQSLASDSNARVTFSTHQTMINYIDTEDKKFTVGRFDLIIIDEAHRSIFKKYGAIFKYFDCLLVGLTATPKEEVDKNTYDLFDCESGVPNFVYSLEEAVRDHYLVPYKLINRKVKSMYEGIAYTDLSAEDQQSVNQLSDVEFTDESLIKSELFKKIYNIDSCRKVLDDLMTMGLRVEQGQLLGKTIIFAVNHYHAEMIVDTFNKMYPMYPEYCKLIDNRVKNSDDLIIEFENDPKFRIAVSVDMLDTGIDVPPVLNLVFFKKINSETKLIQMIGRGTRLCEGLIDGNDKKYFYIFDYFNNFKDQKSESPMQNITIAQKVFLDRLNIMCLLQTSEHQVIPEEKQYYCELKDILIKAVKFIKSNGSDRLSVREKMDVVDKYCDDARWQYISAVDEKEISYGIVPIVESDIKEDYLNLSFDNKMLNIEYSLTNDGNLSTLTNLTKKVSINVTHMTTDDLRKYLTDYQIINDCSKTTVDNIRRNLSSFFSWLEEENYILKSPMKRIHKIKTDKVVKETLTDENLEQLRDNCTCLRDLAIIDILASTGMRVGELVRLNINDIDFESRECVVFGKGNKERPVYFDAKAKIHLKNYLNSRNDDNKALFVSLDAPYNRLEISGVEIRLRNLGRKIGINRVHPHKFRRTVATKAIDKGMPIEQVQHLLGHSQIDTTLHYAMVNQNNVRESHKKYIS